jgi:hypothetical protein
MSLFGRKHEEEATPAGPDPTELEAAIRRLDAMAIPDLAAAVMASAFGPGANSEDPDEEVTVGGANFGSGATVDSIAYGMAPERSLDGYEPRQRLRFERLVAEGVQALEHASLIRAQMHTHMNGLDYTPTRLGRRAATDGSVAERINQP